MQPDEQLGPGTMLGVFRIVRLLGQGGMAAVYEAVSPADERVALKVLRGDLSDDPDVRARFHREARMASKVDHPHIAGGRGMHEINGTLVLEMEYLEGETLGALCDRLGPMDLGVLAEVILPIVSALQAVHNAGIVHRDVKPDNIFLAHTRDGGVSPRLLDFGISKLTYGGGTAITKASTTLGTVSYMSPEQAGGRASLDARTDQYALGVVLYECATGVMPFSGHNLLEILNAIHTGKFDKPSVARPGLPEAFDAPVLRAMAADPAERFPDLIELGRALLPFVPEPSRSLWAPVFKARESDPEVPEILVGEFEATLSSAAMEALVNDLGPRSSDERVTMPLGIVDRDSRVIASFPPPEPSSRAEAPAEASMRPALKPTIMPPPEPVVQTPEEPSGSSPAQPPAQPTAEASPPPEPATQTLWLTLAGVLLAGLGMWLLLR